MSNKLLGTSRVLAALEGLQQTIQQCTAREDDLKGRMRQEIGRLEKQHRIELEEAAARLNEQTARAEGTLQARSDAMQRKHDLLSSRIEQAILRATESRRAAVDAVEGRKISRVQRELLDVSKEQEGRQNEATRLFNEFMKGVEEEREAADRLEVKAYAAFRGYGGFQKQLLKDPEPVEVANDAAETSLLEQTRRQRDQARRSLTAFRWQPLPLLFWLLPPWLFLILLTVGHGALWMVMRHKGHLDYGWQQAAIGFGASVAGMFVLHFLGRLMAGGSARRVLKDLAELRGLVEATQRVAEAGHEQAMRKIQADADARNEALNARWQEARAEADQLREAMELRLNAQITRTRGLNDRLLQTRLNRVNETTGKSLGQLNSDAGTLRDQRIAEFKRKRAEMEKNQTDEWNALVGDWTRISTETIPALQSVAAAAAEQFPAWTAEYCSNWNPPSALIPFASYARMEVDVAALAGTMPVDPRLAFRGPAMLDLPLLLEVPTEGSLLFETKETGRTAAIGCLNEVILRLFSVAPAGRMVFTILDPLDLGQSFAGFMHLADHEDRLINRKIWTQSDHIEQRLAELSEHIEKVTQLYLRNEYESITEYNRQAGRIAEPYHFLVIADFPVNFTEIAVKRLQSIAASGPRCGVYLLIHWDHRKAAPNGFEPDDLRRSALTLKSQGTGFAFAKRTLPGTRVLLNEPPSAELSTLFLQRVGQGSVDSNRVEVPFADIAPEPDKLWLAETTSELRVPIGRTGATKLQQMALGKGTRQHVLVAGKTGSGKSTLFHVMITNLALWSSPDAVEFYLVDFKKGVEFKCYATQKLPHARVVAIESDRDFGLSVLERVDDELRRRGDLFRKLGAQDLPGYQRLSGDTLPRTLLIIDEFQEFFTEDDRVAQNAALLLDRLVRQGRAFGIHVILGSQTLGGAYTLARTTLGQMVVRIALQCNEADALLIMEDDNPAPRLLSRPGEAIYNDAAGAIEGNSPFQIVWLSDEERETWLAKVTDRAKADGKTRPAPVVFEGNAPADVRDNDVLNALLKETPDRPPHGAHAFLGAPNSIKGPTEAVFHRQSGNHLLIVGQQDESALAMLLISLVSLSAQHPAGSARFLVIDGSPAGSSHRNLLERIISKRTETMQLVGVSDLKDVMAELDQEYNRRNAAEDGSNAPSIYVMVHGLQRFKPLRFEEDFSYSLDESSAGNSPGTTFHNLICEGSQLGLHVIATCDTLNNVNRQISRKALTEFEMRVLFQMSANDSATLMESPKASLLGLHRAVLYNAQQGTAEVFRPYALPDGGWIDGI